MYIERVAMYFRPFGSALNRLYVRSELPVKSNRVRTDHDGAHGISINRSTYNAVWKTKRNQKPNNDSNKIVRTQRIRFCSDRVTISYSSLQDIFVELAWRHRHHSAHRDSKIKSKSTTENQFFARIRIYVLRALLLFFPLFCATKITNCVCCLAAKRNSRANFSVVSEISENSDILILWPKPN